jgi:hypothetical protein
VTRTLALLSLLLAACAAADDPVAPFTAALASPQIAAVVDRGDTAGRHYFELYGSFTGEGYGARVVCNGVEVPNRREYASRGQINLSIPVMPSGTSCSFILLGSVVSIDGVNDRGTTSGRRYYELYGSFPGATPGGHVYSMSGSICDGVRREARVEYQSEGQLNVSIAGLTTPASCTFPLVGNVQLSNAIAPRALAAPGVEILGVNDRGTTAGLRYFELYGRFAASGLRVESVCDGVSLPTTIAYASSGQVNVALASFPGGDWGCGFTVTGSLDGRPRRSPVFHVAAATTHPALPSYVGTYYWGGRTSAPGEDQLAKATAGLRASGFSTARFVITPRVRGERIEGNATSLPYQIDGASFDVACPEDRPFLPCAVRQPAYQSAIGAPGLTNVVLTAYDSASNGATGWASRFLDEAWLTAHSDEVRSEYRDLTYALYETQRWTGKTIIVTNWEADNMLYCGSAYRYATDASFRAGCTGVDAHLRGLKVWFRLRQEGIREGRRLATLAGFGGVTVAEGIEFSTYRLMHGFGPNILEDLVPELRPEWVSYSSYETINKLYTPGAAGEAAVRADLASIQAFLAARSPGTRLMIGEVGYNGSDGELLDGVRAAQIAMTRTAVRLLHEAGIPIVILWVGYDSTPTLDPVSGETSWSLHDGLFESDGSERLLLRCLRAFVAGLG